jgi:hypothetical protein
MGWCERLQEGGKYVNETSSTDASQHRSPKRAPGEGVAAEPTIIAEQHRKPNTGPQSVPKGSPFCACTEVREKQPGVRYGYTKHTQALISRGRRNGSRWQAIPRAGEGWR